MTDIKALTHEAALTLLAYDPECGKFWWQARSPELFENEHRQKIWNTRYAGRETFNTPTGKYLMGTLFHQYVLSHRMAWFMVHGKWPSYTIDHINGDFRDNRISNLRDVTTAENARNRVLSPKNTSGYNGIRQIGNSGKWSVSLTLQKKRYHVGSFDSLEGAIQARKEANRQFGFTDRHGTPIQAQGGSDG